MPNTKRSAVAELPNNRGKRSVSTITMARQLVQDELEEKVASLEDRSKQVSAEYVLAKLIASFPLVQLIRLYEMEIIDTFTQHRYVVERREHLPLHLTLTDLEGETKPEMQAMLDELLQERHLSFEDFVIYNDGDLIALLDDRFYIVDSQDE